MSQQMQAIQQLRKKTGVGVAACQKALKESNWDMEQAEIYLRKRGMASSSKKSDRATTEGAITVFENATSIVFLELCAETDFVVKNERFHAFGQSVASIIAEQGISDIEQLLQTSVDGITVEQMRSTLVQAIGENIQIRRIHVITKQAERAYGHYVHGGGAIASLAVLTHSSSAVAREVAMHIAAAAPQYVSSNDVPQNVLETERAVAQEQVAGKPANVMESIIQGKLNAFYKEHCLAQQLYVKDTKLSVDQFVQSHNADAKIVAFERWSVGA